MTTLHWALGDGNADTDVAWRPAPWKWTGRVTRTGYGIRLVRASPRIHSVRAVSIFHLKSEPSGYSDAGGRPLRSEANDILCSHGTSGLARGTPTTGH
jgi:hypothetical protein